VTTLQSMFILFGALCAAFGVCLVLCLQSVVRWWNSDRNDDDWWPM